MLFTNCALAYTATPYADTVFSSAKVSLSAQINASFTAQTKSKQAEIKVTSCILQIKTGAGYAVVGEMGRTGESIASGIVLQHQLL